MKISCFNKLSQTKSQVHMAVEIDIEFEVVYLNLFDCEGGRCGGAYGGPARAVEKGLTFMKTDSSSSSSFYCAANTHLNARVQWVY